MICFGDVPIGAVLPIPFATYAGSTGASITLTGLAVTDIEVYKGTSMTQRASDAGYALMDTDGIDIDTITGIHGFSIDTGDNTDAGFYASGSYYWVVVSAVTIDSQTVNFIAATFRCVTAEGVAGQPKVDVGAISGDATAADNAEAFFDGTGYAGTGNVIPTVTTLTNLPSITANWLTAAGIAAGALDGKGNWNVGKTGYSLTATTGLGDQTANITGNLSGSVGSVTAEVTANMAKISGSGAAADALEESTEVIGTITCTSGGTTTSVIASAVTPASAVNDQFNGRIAIFKGNVTAALAGQATTISDYDHATLTFTVVALTTAPASGDLAVIL